MKKQMFQCQQLSAMIVILTIFIFGAFCAVYAQGTAQNSKLENFIGTNFTNLINIPTGEYALMSVTSQRRDGSPNVNTNVRGFLTLKGDGTYEHPIYIGNSPGGCGPGTYSISGDTLHLNPAGSTGCQAEDWQYIYDAGLNRMSLRDENVTLLYCKTGENDCFDPKE